MVARSGQQPRGHCRNSLSCKRPLVERLSTIWSSQTWGVGLVKNSLREKGGWRCLLFFRLCVWNLWCHSSQQKRNLHKLLNVFTQIILSQMVHTVEDQGQNVGTIQVFYVTRMSRLAVNTLAINLAGLLLLFLTWQQSSTILCPPYEV